MTTDIPDNGGPAFPVTNSILRNWSGMTLRDYFAGQALVAMSAEVGAAYSKTELANRAYALADVMLMVRDL